MKKGKDWLKQYASSLFNGIRAENDEKFFDRLVRRIQADALDSIASLVEEKTKDWGDRRPYQIFAEIRRVARETEP